MKVVLRTLIHLYRYTLSPVLGPRCRFHPTCSVYALDVLDAFPLSVALPKIIKRLGSCHPFHRGGFDPAIPVKEHP
ncbi:MAG: membrane protein insertion efficiency factor YidD [Candidatus Margulisiibacteriota bacterium]